MPLLYKRFVEVQLPDFTVNALKIAFDVSRQPDESHVNGEVAIYNLTKDREKTIENRGGAISLRAGYGDGAATIFQGVMGRVIREREPLARITRIDLIGGSAPVAQATKLNRQGETAGVTTRSYQGEQTIRQVVIDLIGDMGLMAGPLDLIPADAKVDNWADAGKTNRILRDILKRVNLTWYEDDGVVRFNSRQRAQPDAPVIYLSPETGLIGTPSHTDDGAVFTSFLNPLARIGVVVDVDSVDETFRGRWKVAGIQHRGDNWTDKFQTIMDARRLQRFEL